MGIGDMLQAELDAEDAKRYRWLREQHWAAGTLVVVAAKDVQPGTQTYTQQRLDEEIEKRR